MTTRRSPRARGYIGAVVETHAAGRHGAHIFELGRHGAYISTDAQMRAGEGVALHIDVDRRFEEATGAPDIITLVGVVVDDSIEEQDVKADHYRIEFTEQTTFHWWAYIDAMIAAYRMRYVAPGQP